MTNPNAPANTAPTTNSAAGSSLSNAGSNEWIAGRYRIFERLGSGGMATVYLAGMEGPGGFGKLVAIKRIHPHMAHTPRFVDMFLDEARIVSRIDHPNVCSVLDFGETEDTYFLAMEYIMGETVLSILESVQDRRQMLSTPEWRAFVAYTVAEACEGLHAAHELEDEFGSPLNIVHRDVSPDNIFVSYKGTVKVMDFGIASAEGRLHKTVTGVVKGKFGYMPPEVLSAAPDLDRRIDVWALGVCLWEMLVGERLFHRPADAAIIAAIMLDPIPRPSERTPDVEPALEDIVLGAITRERDERIPTARELGRRLREYVAQSGVMMTAVEAGELVHSLHIEQAGHKQAQRARIQQIQTSTSGKMHAAKVPTGVRAAPAASFGTQLNTLDEVPAPGPALNMPGSAGLVHPPAAVMGFSQAPQPVKGRGTLIAIIVVLLLGLVGGAAWFLVGPGKSRSDGDRVAGSVPQPGSPLGAADIGSADIDPADIDPANIDPAGEKREPATTTGEPDAPPTVPDKSSDDAEPDAPKSDDQASDDQASAKRARRSSRRSSRAKKKRVKDSDNADEHAAVPANKHGGEPIVAVSKSPVEPVNIEPTIPPPSDSIAPVKSPPVDTTPSLPEKPASYDAKTSIGSLSSSGSLARSHVSRAVKRQQSAFGKCYRASAKKAGRSPGGAVTIKLKLNESGRARNVSVDGARLPGLSSCLEKAAGKIRSRRAPDVGEVPVSFKVEFTPK